METLVGDVNSHMRQRQEQERLKTIIARIDSYEPIETKDEELQVLIIIITTIIMIIIMIDSYEPIETKEEELQVNENHHHLHQNLHQNHNHYHPSSGLAGNIYKLRLDLPNAGLCC